MSAYSITTRGLDGRKVPQGTLTAMGALLFGSSEQGAWYDPSDLSTMFQDSAGTTPVTAVEQPVGLILDKSQGLVLGPELVTGGGFDNSANWTSSAWTVSAGVATYPDTLNDFIRPANANLLPLVAGKAYCVRFTLSGVTGSAVCAVTNADGSVAYTAITTFTTNGEKQFIIYAAASTTNIRFYGYTSSGGTWSLDDLSVRELPGNHASQATSTKRPTYSRRYNLVTGSEMTGGAGGTPGTAPDGWQIHVMNGTYSHTVEAGKHRFSATSGRSTIRNPITWVPNTSYTVEVTLTNNATTVGITSLLYLGLWTGTGVSTTYYVDDVIGTQISPGTHKVKIVTSFTGGTPLQYLYAGVGAGSAASGDVTLVDASIALSIDAHLPYQWVNTATDYDDDPDKFPAYLAFDGVNRALATGNIDFTSTDKMTVFAGVTRLTSTGSGFIAELSTSSTSTNGSWRIADLRADGNFGSSQAFGSRGTILASVNAAAIGGPANTVITGAADIGAGTLAASGFLDAPVAANQGTGNYGNYPLYIGARAGTSLYFNGRLYGLIVRGAESTLSQLEAGELYERQKMRMP